MRKLGILIRKYPVPITIFSLLGSFAGLIMFYYWIKPEPGIKVRYSVTDIILDENKFKDYSLKKYILTSSTTLPCQLMEIRVENDRKENVKINKVLIKYITSPQTIVVRPSFKESTAFNFTLAIDTESSKLIFTDLPEIPFKGELVFFVYADILPYYLLDIDAGYKPVKYTREDIVYGYQLLIAENCWWFPFPIVLLIILRIIKKKKRKSIDI